MSDIPRFLIYAELLSNIRQVSVGCSLPSETSTGTMVNVSVDGQSLTVHHRDEERSVQLPERVAAPSTLPLPKTSTTNLSWRLPLAAPQSTPLPPSLEAQEVPWSAQDLKIGACVRCRTCEACIVNSRVIESWKDLPSENWAEMMEFWHCHKPDDHNRSNDQKLTARGYGANSRISAQPNTGFVDLTSFLFLRKDCTNLTQTPSFETAPSQDGQPQNFKTQSPPLHCTNCSSELGVLNEETSSVTLFKWQITVDNQVRPSRPSQPSLANCVSSMLMSTVARSGCSKSIIMPVSSPESSQSSISAVKVLYRTVSREEADKMMEPMTSDVQEIRLPKPAVEGVAELLEQSNRFLPESDREFMEWTVGLLRKWKRNGR
ncbi:ubiquitin-conjugating enzyme E2-binding protein [Xylariales sp. AK1849]|nr:ubiquitin-conjugating enzyme E2-binding protein [Xylariales sp. AK1849]